MKTITMMRSEIAALQKSMGDLKAQAIADSRDLEDSELDLINNSIDQIEKIQRSIATEERMQATDANLAQPTTEVVRPEPNGTKETRELFTITDNKERFSSLGEQLMAIVRASDEGNRYVDPRLNTRAASGLNETIPSDGGFLVQTDFTTDIFKQVFETGKLAPLCNDVVISGNSNSTKMNGIDETSRATGSRYGGVRGYWIGEADEKTASRPKFRQILLDLKKLAGLCWVTDENLADASQLEGIVKQAFISEFNYLVDDSIINGTGAGQPKGIVTTPGPCVTVSAEAGQAANSIVYENVNNMWSRLFAESRSNAIWLINQDCEPQLHQMSISVGTGGIPVYMPSSGISGSPYSTLFNRPVIPIEQCQTVGDTGDIILADLSGYYLARKGGIKQDVSIHVRFAFDEKVFRFVLRVDGQPMLESAITPANSALTLSHFVKLEAR